MQKFYIFSILIDLQGQKVQDFVKFLHADDNKALRFKRNGG